jgi:C4-dicarboxylate-specific signal transduction histidine kinase
MGILYLENDLTPYVFTPPRIAVLKLLASQAAISLENARLYSEIQQAQRELAHVTRVTTMGQLAASIAHEVSQPVVGVLVNGNTALRWLARIPETSESHVEAREAVQRIVRDGGRARDVIARLRSLFKKTDAERIALDLNNAIEEVIVLTRTELEKRRVALRLDLASELPSILGDRVALQQVMMNLILNATDAMSGIDDRPRELRIETKLVAPTEVLTTVVDSGIGLDAQALDKLFVAFHTTKSHGLGMGLSISRSIVESHQGRLWASANSGPGATFQFTLLTA